MKLPSGQYACVQSPTEVQMDAVLASHTQHKARKHSSPPTHTHTHSYTHTQVPILSPYSCGPHPAETSLMEKG